MFYFKILKKEDIASFPNVTFSLSEELFMATLLPKYKSIKNKYCIGYFGKNKFYLKQLQDSIPYIEKEFPEISIQIACNDEDKNLLNEKHQ